MPICKECGAELNADSRFCPECGTKTEPAEDKPDDNLSEPPSEGSSGEAPDDKQAPGTSAEENAADKSEDADEDIPDENTVEDTDETSGDISDTEEPGDDIPAQDTAEISSDTAEKADAPAPAKKINIFPVILGILMIAGIGAGVYLSTGGTSAQSDVTAEVPPVSVSIETTSVDLETAAVSETTAPVTVTTKLHTAVSFEKTEETTVSSAESTESESETSETGPVLMRTTIEPAAHEQVMGRGISCTVTLSEALITPDMLSDTSTFTAEYTAAGEMPMAPVGLMLTIGGDEIDVPASSYDETTVVFRCDVVRAFVEDSGHSFDEINELSFISAGMPVDVSKVIIE